MGVAGVLFRCSFIIGWSGRGQSCCTERSTHTCARVPADLARAPDGGGKVEGGSGDGFYDVLHTETYPKHSQIPPKSDPQIGRNLWKFIEIRRGRSLVMIASQRPYCIPRRPSTAPGLPQLANDRQPFDPCLWMHWRCLVDEPPAM